VFHQELTIFTINEIILNRTKFRHELFKLVTKIFIYLLFVKSKI